MVVWDQILESESLLNIPNAIMYSSRLAIWLLCKEARPERTYLAWSNISSRDAENGAGQGVMPPHLVLPECNRAEKRIEAEAERDNLLLLAPPDFWTFRRLWVASFKWPLSGNAMILIWLKLVLKEYSYAYNIKDRFRFGILLTGMLLFLICQKKTQKKSARAW